MVTFSRCLFVMFAVSGTAFVYVLHHLYALTGEGPDHLTLWSTFGAMLILSGLRVQRRTKNARD